MTSSAFAQGFFSPGALSKAHHSLEGDDHCGDCHSGGRGVTNQQCVKCHAPIQASINSHTGLHGLHYGRQQCGQCHVEHLGVSAEQIRWPGGSEKKFNHALSGWPLGGAHADERCSSCHEKPDTFLGLSSKCSSCHEDVHKNRFGSTCQTCHNEVNWGTLQLRTFDHALAKFPLKGLHAKVECAKCHNSPPQYTGLEFSKCTSCHEDPHAGRFQQTCESCHVETGWKQFGKMRSNHPGVSLASGHSDLACARCHDRGADASPSKGTECASCHKQVHEAKFGRDCKTCHASIKWQGLPDSIGRKAHPKTDFPLHGAHADVACASCHNPKLPANTAFRSLAYKTCAPCHSDPHKGEFAQMKPNDCANCHSDAAFRPSDFGAKLHAATDFPLDGKHVAVACAACHKGSPPRLSFQVAKSTCASCHENPHDDQFAKEMSDGGCAHCHNTGGWKRPKVDHSIWPLEGAHEAADCDACHTATTEDRRSGRGQSYRGVPRDCESCHEDAHFGQFTQSEPKRSCDFCHDAASFEIEAFDHGRLANYPLDGGHEGLECGKCHATQSFGEDIAPVRWRLGYNRCADCHANPHDAERGAP